MSHTLKKTIAAGAAACMLAACAAGCGAPANTPAEGGSYTIGICQLMEHSALDAATQGFEDALIELLGEENVTFDLQNAQGDSQTCATIANTFVSNNYDLILANATASLQASATATDTIPIIGTSVTNFGAALDLEMDENGCTGINVTGTNDLAPLDQQADMIAELFPDAQNVGILFCSAEVNSQYQADHIAEALEALGIPHTTFTFADSNDLQTVTQNAVAACDVLYIPTDNTAASNTGIIDAIARPAGVPIIAGEEGLCAGCGLATYSISFYDIGHRAGEMAYEILVNGADPATMPVEDPTGLTTMYNAEIAADLGITLPDTYVAMGE